MQKNYILLTNDDGVSAVGITSLAKALSGRGYRIVILAPKADRSATGMSITLRSELSMSEHQNLAESIGGETRVFSLDGSPCDCIIVGLSGALRDKIPDSEPMLCVSGINLGPNLSVDVLHSGTVGAAREAALYGLPSLATSLCEFESSGLDSAVDASVKVIEQLLTLIPPKAGNLLRPQLGEYSENGNSESCNTLNAYCRGDIFLNLNVPKDWNGEIENTRIGMRWYRNALHRGVNGDSYSIDGAEIISQPVGGCDVAAVESGSASLSPCQTWPDSHPLSISLESLQKPLIFE
jgi:5'/3'-nucleotidase SurE